MAWSSHEKNTALKLIKEKFLKQFVQSTLNLIGSFEIDAIICLTVGNEQLVIKLHERLKHNHFDQGEVRNNGEPSLLREYLAGNTAVPKPKPSQPHVRVSCKRKTWDENENTIYSPDKRIQYADQITDAQMKVEPSDDQEVDEIPLNLSGHCCDQLQVHEDKELSGFGKRENAVSREPFGQYSCGLCLLKYKSYASLQDHFVDAHNSNLRFICSECSVAFADNDAYSKHRAKHSRQSLSTANRRKQTKPRKGVAASELSDDDIPQQNSYSTQSKVQPVNENGPRHHSIGAPGANAVDQSEGIVRSLLQKQSPLSISGVPDHPYSTKHSSASPLDLAARDVGEASAKEFCCPHCGVLLQSWNLYNEHCKQVHKRFACNVCLQTFTQRVNRDRHHYNHTGEKPYECDQCGLGFTRRDALKKHQAKANHMVPPSRGIPEQASSSIINYQPDPDLSDDSANEDCPLPFESLDNSEIGDSKDAGQVDDDEIQGKPPSKTKRRPSSGSKSRMQRAVLELGSHLDDGEISDEMSVHSFHSGDNGNFQGISDPAGLRPVDVGNQRPASAEPPREDALKSFKCDSCQELVVGAMAFQDHCKVLHRRTPCIYCGKTFSQKGNMERHMRQHTGERPFHCQFCSSSYTRKETLKTHLNQAHSYQLKQEPENL